MAPEPVTTNAGEPATSPGRGVDRIRLLTYNIRGFKDDREALVRVIRALGPDVVCLQEVPRHVFSGHRIGDLASECGLLWSGGGDRTGGTAILTSLRVDLLETDALSLPVRRFARPRGMASALLAVPAGPAVRVASVHLGLDCLERLRHARLILDRLRAGARAAPCVVAGDLNERPAGPAWRVLASEVSDAASEPAAPTFPSGGPTRRIDAVLTSPDIRVEALWVPGRGEPVGADPVDPGDLSRASDHLPVLADLALPSQSAPA